MENTVPDPTVSDPTRMTLTDEGPALVTGPVEIDLPDGRRVRSDRPVTALCLCRRSRRWPICDTSHRTKVRETPKDETDEEDDPC